MNAQIPPPPGSIPPPPAERTSFLLAPWVGIVLSFFVCWPIGVALVWASPRNPTGRKVLVTILSALWVSFVILAFWPNKGFAFSFDKN